MGSLAGLCLIWNKSLVKQESLLYGSRWLSLTFEWFAVKVKLILVYGFNTARERSLLWEELKLQLIFEGLIEVIGDFNEVVDLNKRHNGGLFNSSIQCFVDFINSSN